MDILERIIEAVAQKLISMRLNEEQDYGYSHKQDTGNRMAGSRRKGPTPLENKPQGYDGPEVEPVKGQKAGASGGERARRGDIATKSNFNRPARNTPIKPQGQSAGGRGGQEETTSERATPPDKPKGRILSREEAKEKLMRMRNKG